MAWVVTKRRPRGEGAKGAAGGGQCRGRGPEAGALPREGRHRGRVQRRSRSRALWDLLPARTASEAPLICETSLLATSLDSLKA